MRNLEIPAVTGLLGGLTEIRAGGRTLRIFALTLRSMITLPFCLGGAKLSKTRPLGSYCRAEMQLIPPCQDVRTPNVVS